jgi:hypothetical protein
MRGDASATSAWKDDMKMGERLAGAAVSGAIGCAGRRAAVLGAFVALAGAVPLTGCVTAGIALRESLGIPKRLQLADRVKEARDSQDDAKEQFESALMEFLGITQLGEQLGTVGKSPKQAELESRYKSLNGQYERSVSKAKQVTDRIEAVETVGDKLFVEWNRELDEYTDAKLRSLSETQMNDARNRYDELLRVMRNAESKMPPVLDQLRNQVLFLKHNLNAQAISGLGEIAVDVQNDVALLIADMETAIREANAFIESLAGA